MRFWSRSLSTMSSCWESIFRAHMAFPGVFYWDRVQSVQLIMSVFKCPKVFGRKLLQTWKKYLIIRAPRPEHGLGSWKFRHLLRSWGQNGKQVRAKLWFQMAARTAHWWNCLPGKSRQKRPNSPFEWFTRCTWDTNRSQKVYSSFHPEKHPFKSPLSDLHPGAWGFWFGLKEQCILNYQDHGYTERCMLNVADTINCRHKVTVCSCLQLIKKKITFYHSHFNFKLFQLKIHMMAILVRNKNRVFQLTANALASQNALFFLICSVLS